MYKVTDTLEKNAVDINVKAKMEKEQMLEQIKILEDEISNKEAFANGKEKEMEWQKKNAPYYANYLNGKNELGSTWYLEELKHKMRQTKNAKEQKKVLDKIEKLDLQLSDVRSGKISIEQFLSKEKPS